jgi:hypothetical protein
MISFAIFVVPAPVPLFVISPFKFAIARMAGLGSFVTLRFESDWNEVNVTALGNMTNYAEANLVLLGDVFGNTTDELRNKTERVRP